MQEVVIGIVVKDANVLLVQKKNPKGSPIWRFPGGKVKDGEDTKAAVIREIKEETSIDCQPVGEIAERNWYSKGLKLIFFICDYVSGDAQLNEPHTFNLVQWVSPEKAEKLIGQSAKIQIRDFLKWLIENKLWVEREATSASLEYMIQENKLLPL